MVDYKTCKECVISELKKENAELKEKLNKRSCQNCKHNNKSWPSDGSCKNYSKWEGYKNPQLTKAKEIIKKFSEFVNNDVEYDPEHPQEHTDLWNKLCKEAEQFLSKVEKWQYVGISLDIIVLNVLMLFYLELKTRNITLK